MNKTFEQAIQNFVSEWNSNVVSTKRRYTSFIISIAFLLFTLFSYVLVGYELKAQGEGTVWKLGPLVLVTLAPQLCFCWYVLRSNSVPAYVRNSVLMSVFTVCWWLLFTVIIYLNMVNA